MDGYAVRAADVAGATRRRRSCCRWSATSRRARRRSSPCTPGMSARIMTGRQCRRAPRRSSRSSGPTAACPSVAITQPARARRARPPPRRGRAGWADRAGRGHAPGPGAAGLLAAVGRARVLVQPQPRVVVISTGSELVEPGTTPRARPDHRLQRRHARRGGAGGRRDRLPRRHRPRRPAHPARHARGPAGPRRPGGHHRRGQRRRLRHGQGGALAARHGRVRTVAMQPGMPQGHGLGPDEHADLHAARQPGVGVRLLRGLRPAGDPADARAEPFHRPDGARRSAWRARLAGGQAPVRPRPARGRGRALRRRAPSAARARTCSARWPRPTPGRRARGRHRVNAGEPVAVLLLERRLV